MAKSKKKARPLGQLLLDLEPLLEELVDDHELQWYDVLYLTYGWLAVHRPDAREEYLDGSFPVFYGPQRSK